MFLDNQIKKFMQSAIDKFIDSAEIARSSYGGNLGSPAQVFRSGDIAQSRKEVQGSAVAMQVGADSGGSPQQTVQGGERVGSSPKEKQKGDSEVKGSQALQQSQSNEVAASRKSTGEKEQGGADGYIEVQSSNLKAIKFDSEKKELRVQFLSGTEYSYDNIQKQKFNNLYNATSKGSYFYWNIRGKGRIPQNPPYPYKKIK